MTGATVRAHSLAIALVSGAMVASLAIPLAQRLDNAAVETRTLTRALDQEIADLAGRGRASWIVWRAPLVAGPRRLCCRDEGRCRLERGSGVSMSMDDLNAARAERVMLEPPEEFLIFVRVEAGQVGRVRTFTPECAIDAGGMPVVRLEGVVPTEGLAWLSAQVNASAAESGDRYDRVAKTALAAVALHDVPEADAALESFMAAAQPAQLREDATFWIGSARGDSGVRLLARVIAADSSVDVREKAVFGLSVSRSPASLPALIASATRDANADVRSRALFWLANRAGKEATETIAGAITNDPDTEVKKKAVFALSQLPKDEGVPRLIDVARTNRNPAVRKQAMFWLGQSNDPRAVQFFAEVLAGK
jgi:hypothetical protein